MTNFQIELNRIKAYTPSEQIPKSKPRRQRRQEKRDHLNPQRKSD